MWTVAFAVVVRVQTDRCRLNGNVLSAGKTCSVYIIIGRENKRMNNKTLLLDIKNNGGAAGYQDSMKMSLEQMQGYCEPTQNWVVACELEVQRNFGFTVRYNPKLSSSATTSPDMFPLKSQPSWLELSMCRGLNPNKYQVRNVQFVHSFPRMLTSSYLWQTPSANCSVPMISMSSNEARR